MSKLIISPEEFIAEVNKQLPNIGGYESGMLVSLYPEGSNGASASGYSLEPDTIETRAVVGTAVSQVLFEFDVDPNLSRSS
ncbi:hypothetical protein [Paraburkholderia hospita]|uniref:hypothetical protein n=1 Tax=Paraburkholderia hospita TaxID=169430 RepID=UPI000B347EAD|nr:hypothetical protein [Paraburkholderia hospita]OUL80706.1 hypothetical protein CA603_31375 [Paraburkholderia hospita]OUL94111.1 hypothetical protein CA601_09060 [Paraburkholderia hospita]